MRWLLLLRFLLPTLAGLAVAVVVVGPGREREVLSARVYGLLTPSSKIASLRVVLQRHMRGAYGSGGSRLLQIQLHHNTKRIAQLAGRSDEQGYAELQGSIDDAIAPRGPLRLRVRSDGHTIAEGDFEPQAALGSRNEAAPDFRNASREPNSRPLMMQLHPPRGFVVPEMPEEVQVTVRGARSRDVPKLKLRWSGARVLQERGPAAQCEGQTCHWIWTLRIMPFALAVEADATATSEAAKGRWVGNLSVSPGSTWLDPDALKQRKLRLRAGSPRDRVFVSFISSAGRVAGRIIELKRTKKGYFESLTDLPKLPKSAVAIRIASDSAERGSSHVSYPLRAAQPRVESRPLALLIDGLKKQVEKEKIRATNRRQQAAAFIGFLGVVQLLLLFLARQRELSPLGSQAQEPDLELLQKALEPPSLGRTLLSALAIALAFCAMMAVALYV